MIRQHSRLVVVLSAGLVVAHVGLTQAQQGAPRPQPAPAQRPALTTPPVPPAAEPALSFGSGAPYLTQFPEGDVYKLTVFGDGFAEGLVNGLVDALANETRVQVQRKHKPLGPLIRPEFEDEVRVEETARDVVHIAVLMFGQGDRNPIRQGSQRLAVGTEEWQQEYGRRVDRLLRGLKRRNMAIYLISQPPLRQPNANRDAETINEILLDRARANNVRFIDITEGFQDESGAFTQFGPDLSGNRQRLREGDGISFSTIGFRKLAHYVERDVRRDINHAKSDRIIPLAGNEAEQKRINPQRVPGTATGPVAQKAPGAAKSATVDPGPNTPPGDGSGEQRADNGRIVIRSLVGGREETAPIDIIRPAIPAAVMQLVTRREVTEKLTQPGEAMVAETSSGFLVVSSIAGLAEGQGQTPQRRGDQGPSGAFYNVMVRGERLPPKPGRADDFTWPKPDVDLLPAPVRPAAAQPKSTPRPPPPRDPQKRN